MFKDLILYHKESNLHERLHINKVINTKLIDNIAELRKSEFPIIFKSNIILRKIVETKKAHIITNCEEIFQHDSINSRNSGVDHIICKLASVSNIAFAFNFNLVLKNNGQRRAKILGRMIQNVILFRKYKVKMILTSLATNEYELRSQDALRSFGSVIGMSPKETLDATQYVTMMFSKV